jgi:rhomboid family GlyGly-CTERM serine protease
MLPTLPIGNKIQLQWNHALWLLILTLTFSLQAGGLVADWRFDRALIAQHHYWLLFSGHCVHLNWNHWWLNMGGLAIVAFFFSPYGKLLEWLWVIVIAALCCGVGMYWLNPEVKTYVGLSGVLHGLFIYGAMRETRYYPASGYVLLVLLTGKLIWEFMNGALPGSESMTGGRVVTDAHLYGAIGGAIAAVLLAAKNAACSK